MSPRCPRIRVLLIAPSLEILGGQSVQASRLLNGFAGSSDLQVDFQPINPRLPGRLREIRYVRTVLNGIFYLTALLWRIPRYDIVHVFSASYSSYSLWTLPAMILGRLFGKKVILNYRDGQVDDHLTKWRSAKPTLRLAHRIISPSEYVADVFGQHGIRASRIYNVLSIERFPYRQREKLRPAFLTTRILEPLYNVDCILRAFQILLRTYPDASLTISHDGVSRPHLERLARELELRNYRFLGRVPHDQITELYADADIYLTTPDWDCMPGSLLECFASGLPVIATNVGGIPYLLDHERTGLLIERNDHEALAAAAIRLMNDQQLVVELTRNARDECEKYRWDTIGKQWHDVYRELAEHNPPSCSPVAEPRST